MSGSVWAQGAPFTCDGSFYQTRAGGGQTALLRFSDRTLAKGGAARNVYGRLLPIEVNAVAFSKPDGFIYGLQQATQQPKLIKLGESGYVTVGNIVTVAGQTPALTPTFLPLAGAMDARGRYYFYGQRNGDITPGAIYRVDDLNPAGGNVQVAAAYPLSEAVPILGDVAFGPDGNLYAATGNSLVQFQLTSNRAIVVKKTITDVGAVGSSFFNSAGVFFGFANSSDQLFKINFAFGDAFKNSPASSKPVANFNVTNAGPVPTFESTNDGAFCVDDLADKQRK